MPSSSTCCPLPPKISLPPNVPPPSSWSRTAMLLRLASACFAAVAFRFFPTSTTAEARAAATGAAATAAAASQRMVSMAQHIQCRLKISKAATYTLSMFGTSFLSKFSTNNTYFCSSRMSFCVISCDGTELQTRHGSRMLAVLACQTPTEQPRHRKPRHSSTYNLQRLHAHLKCQECCNFCCLMAVCLGTSSSARYEIVSSSPFFSQARDRKTSAPFSPIAKKHAGSQECEHRDTWSYNSTPSSLWWLKALYRQTETSRCNLRWSMGFLSKFSSSFNSLFSSMLCMIRTTSSPGSSSGSSTNLSNIMSMDGWSNRSSESRAAK
mmetsp:Transcript_32828/g.94452  ORF Transcript_32828/g.94452 Transcript_32828/m.94452 type:complete len:323 (-) Transcript_32828:521-1489(-)